MKHNEQSKKKRWQRFRIDDVVRYNGNIYQIVWLRLCGSNLVYDVKCLKNNFPDEPVASSIGSIAEDKMELVDFTATTEKLQWIEKAIDYIQQHWIWNKKMIEDFKKHMEKYP